MAVKAGIGATRLYATLCKVLDALRREAPSSLTIYHSPNGNNDALIQARSRALLHLFLKARFGLTSFDSREHLVTDGMHDGGIDAYYIDKNQRRIYLLQSKFRAKPGNFVSNNVSANDLLKIDVKRILQGKNTSDSGEPYNARIKKMQAEIKKIPDVGSYIPLVVLLGNSENLSAANLKKLVDGYEVEQYPHERAYIELLFPVVNGTYFTSSHLTIEISLENLKSGDTHLDYNVKTLSLKANIKVLFVPTREIGRIMHTYKNSILKYNPRSFLELKNNAVNREIEASIVQDGGNEFALFNNGITLISDYTVISSNTAKQGRAQVVVTNPQLVNGGQTAYTLGRRYEHAIAKGNYSEFRGKEVLVKIISFVPSKANASGDPKKRLISDISKASNSQSKIDESDRRSNDPVQIELQERFFSSYGLYYERKRGEFSDGIHYGYISESEVIKREKLVRISLAAGNRSNQAKAGLVKFFKEPVFSTILSTSDIAKYAYGFEVLRQIEQVKKTKRPKSDRWQTKAYGYALQYAEYAVVAACIDKGMAAKKSAEEIVKIIIGQWLAFEVWVAKKKANAGYLQGGKLNAVSYYKGSTVNNDLKNYPFKLP